MTNLYEIKVEHIGSHSSHVATECYVIADTEEEVYSYLNHLSSGAYAERHNEELENVEEGFESNYIVYNEQSEAIGHETYKEYILRIKGDINDENRYDADPFYGVNVYGWEDKGPITFAEFKKLSKFIKIERASI